MSARFFSQLTVVIFKKKKKTFDNKDPSSVVWHSIAELCLCVAYPCCVAVFPEKSDTKKIARKVNRRVEEFCYFGFRVISGFNSVSS
jgi:hypothetical protein